MRLAFIYAPPFAAQCSLQLLKLERGRSASVDITRASGPLSATLTLFYSRISDPVEVERDRYVLTNLQRPTTNSGLEISTKRSSRASAGV